MWSSSGLGHANFPKVVPNSGALVGKRVLAIAVGDLHNLALCADGTLATWGYNYSGQLGNNSSATTDTPVLVDRTGVLAGKEIVDIEAGSSFSVALCSDATVAEWGWLSGSQSGGEISRVPVSMQSRGALVGKKVVKLRGGFNNGLALCGDGTLVCWGANGSGELGNGTPGASYSGDRYAPVAVTMTGVLAGKTIQEMALASGTCLVLCSDGTLVSWGNNSYGQLGNGNKTNSSVPVLVNQTGVLSGRSVAKVFAGQSQFYALCRDGTMAAWGYNYYGGLGNGNKTDSMVPVLVSGANFAAGGSFAWSGGPGSAYNQALALSALPPAATATTLAASAVTDTGATLNAAVQPNGTSTTVKFEFGLTSAYGGTLGASPSPVSGVGTVATSAVLTELLPGSLYHCRVVVTNGIDTAIGDDTTFTTSALATLADLVPDSGTLMPGFSNRISAYALTVPFATTSLSLTPTVAQPGTTVTVNDVAVATGTASGQTHLAVGNTVIPVRVTTSAGTITDTYTVTVTRVAQGFAFNAATDVAVSAAGFVATGNPAVFTLGFAPPVGTVLTVVNNTGSGCIDGTFDNLAQGQPVALDYNGIAYQFVANYYGGTGNDLVLQWANTRLTGWGSNGSGQVAVKGLANQTAPVAMGNTGVLAGKTVLTVACGNLHSVALCTDGTLAAWGANSDGQLGNNSTTYSAVPVAVDMSGDLVGKTVVAVAAGTSHSLILCSDGTLAAWGSNSSGQLGNSGTQRSLVPVMLADLGALAGKSIVTIAAGSAHNLALCEDGTLAAWGANESGQLANGGTVPSLVPVAVGAGSVLTGKLVVAVAAGWTHNLALCADGSLAAWGSNVNGQLGNGNQADSLLPVMVNSSGVLAGRTPVAVAVGQSHSMALCADGRVATWGANASGMLGNNTTTDSSVPVLVDFSGILANKTISAVAAGSGHCLAQCSDGTLVAWGNNYYGQLGTNSTNSSLVPVAVTTTSLASGERFVAGLTDSLAAHSFGLVASPLRAGASTLAATSVSDTTATLNASVKSNGSSAAVAFEYGLTSAYGIAVAAYPATITGSGVAAVSASLGNLLMGTTYHFRVRAANGGGTTYGDDRTFTTSDLAGLSGLALSAGSFTPAVTSNVTSYIATVPFGTNSITVTAQTLHATSTLQVNGVAVAAGTASNSLALAVGNTGINLQVTAADGILTRTYTVTVTRLPGTFVYHAADEIPATANGFMASGDSPGLSLGFAPAPGTNLTVINNTGTGMIVGTFANLAQGQSVQLAYNGIVYPFVADYFGGTGNDLVLRWGNTRLLAWGANSSGQLGIGNNIDSLVPMAVDTGGALAGKVVTAVEFGGFPMQSGGGHRLALCADGTVAAWGAGSYGQLGNNATASSNVPVAVNHSGVLAGKQAVRVVAGFYHNLALCDDGTLVAWGNNAGGELGNGTTTNSLVPVAVDQTGVLAGKTVIKLEAGNGSSYAICADGTIARWGGNLTRPVEMVRSGVLAGKTVVEIAVGSGHSLARCVDGTLAAWGANNYGQVGDATYTDRSDPVAVVTNGVLAGKTVVEIAAGDFTSMALCSDGTVAVWGYNQYGGGMGTGAATYTQNVPNAVDRSGVLAGRTVVQVATSGPNFFALCRDGFAATWGNSSNGMLGNSSASSAAAPVALDLSLVRTGERLVSGVTGLVMVASPPMASVETLAVTGSADTRAGLRGRVLPNGSTATLSFDYGLTENYGAKLAAIPATAGGTAAVEVAAPLNGLLPGTTYHYRMVASAAGGIACGQDLTFTTSNQDGLTDIVLDSGTLTPGFSTTRFTYAAAVPYDCDAITVTPVATRPGATVTVNGSVVVSGSASEPIGLAVGNNPIAIVVDAGDGVSTRTYTVTVTRVPEVLAFDSATAVPVTAGCFNATGLTATLALRYAPQFGTILTVVKTTGLDPIRGTFANLAQGQRVYLPCNGIIYQFIANYFGGTGKDLVLQWANTRLLDWGNNASGQLGDGTVANSLVPKAVNAIGALAGKTVIATACGSSHSLALLSDGTVAAWGDNSYGQLGNNSTNSCLIPVSVTMSGALVGKIVTAIAAGEQHSLALCSDGTLAAWGSNSYGELGDNSTTSRTMPVLVDQSGVLQGKAVVAVAAGSYYSLALCGDGTIAAWGRNDLGQLGNGITGTSLKPVMVNTTGVLAGKRVQIMAAGSRHNLAVCSDGTVVSWGGNDYGQLGANSSATFERAPVLVNTAGVLAGKAVAAIATGSSHCLALCTDGTLCAWGYNSNGQLGDGTTTNRSSPIAVDNTWELADKTISTITAGTSHSMALCSDGTLTAWGYNGYGQLGNNTTTNSGVPVVVNAAAIKTGEYLSTLYSGPLSTHVISLLAAPPLPVATTLTASAVNDTSATLNGSVGSNGSATAVAFEYGLTPAYGTSVAAAPASLTGVTTAAAGAPIGGLLSGTIYHYRVIATSAFGTTRSEDLTFTTTTYGTLADLRLSSGTLAPAFAGSITSYFASVPFSASRLVVTPAAAYATSTVTVNGVVVASGAASDPIDLELGDNNVITTAVVAADGINTQTYSVRVTRLPETFTFNSAADVPLTLRDFTGAGNTASFALNYAPAPGARLSVVTNTGLGAIRSPFGNLAQGQQVPLTYNGTTYVFVANYYGGTGNDLVLEWANTRLLGWGAGDIGQLGNNSTVLTNNTPVAVMTSGVLAGKSVATAVTGTSHSLALCTDGTLAAWGNNGYGRLGNNATTGSSVPVLVDATGVLAGKTVIALAAGDAHSLALCLDGTLAAWGSDGSGQLGTADTASCKVPVLVSSAGVLAGKMVAAIAAGGSHNLALCADGTLASWGLNSSGQLGNNSVSTATVPVLVDTTGVLAGKTIIAIGAGGSHSLALCSDGTLATWGSNSNGQLGNNSTTASSVPVVVGRTGVLAGKRVTAIAAGGNHNLAMCADGTLASWGVNSYGQLGNSGTTTSLVPVLVNQAGALAGKTIAAIRAGLCHSLALCADGTVVSWGRDDYGQLGDNNTTASSVPVTINTTALPNASGFVMATTNSSASHSFALLAVPLQSTTPQPATAITGRSATLNGTVNANANATSVAFEYGLDDTYGDTIPASPTAVAGMSDTAMSAVLGGLTPGTIYHYRVVASSFGGIVRSADMSFTTLSDNAKLAALGLSTGTMAPGFDKLTTSYVATVPFAIDGVTATPVTDHLWASVQVAGVLVASGTASGIIPLPVGNTTITTQVTAEDGITSLSYTITVTRLPLNFTFNSASDVPVSANGFAAGGIPADVVLDYAPVPGTILTLVNNTALGFIHGGFSNLAQGQRISLTFNGKTYAFVANYFGGTGNDLVLQWAATQVMAWGSNSAGQLGDNSTTRRLLPTAVDATGVLANKTVSAVSAGYLHSLALCADGTLAAWGYNVYGQLGNDSATPSYVPVAVEHSGALAGKTVIAIASGPFHNLALCADGSVAAWGYNNYGQLATGDTGTRRVPVLVEQTGALTGKHVVAVAAAAYSSFALCDDGTLAAWGYNDEGELGDGTTANSSVPVAVDTTGVLAGKQIAAVTAGQYHTLALCTDGTLVAWGYNNRGQLGNDSTLTHLVPVAVGPFGILSGKTVVASRASGAHSLALCADGTLAAWGWNNKGQLGTTGMTQSSLPIAIDTSGVTAGASIAQIALGGSHSLALCTDGTLAAWGDNAYGQLGNNNTTTSFVPVAVDVSGLAVGARCMQVAGGSAALHNLVMVGLPSVSTSSLADTIQNTALDDSDHDGISNLIDYAFGLHSNPDGTAQLPQPQRIGDKFVLSFTEPAGVTGITYGAEWSTTLLPDSWTAVPDSGTGIEHIFSLPVGTAPRLFMRHKVTQQ